MGQNVSQKLIANHLVDGRMEAGTAVGLRIDQTLTQDATGTLVMLELEAMGIQRVQTELSAQYVDHNLLQTDFKNADDHLFLKKRMSLTSITCGRRSVVASTSRCKIRTSVKRIWPRICYLNDRYRAF